MQIFLCIPTTGKWREEELVDICSHIVTYISRSCVKAQVLMKSQPHIASQINVFPPLAWYVMIFLKVFWIPGSLKPKSQG